MNEYEHMPEASGNKAEEPSAAYGASPFLQGLKKRLKASVDAATDEEKLERCLELLHADEMPCVFTDEEFAEELRLSEESGIASEGEVEAFFVKWGVVR